MTQEHPEIELQSVSADSVTNAKRERLEAEARDRWGDEYFIRAHFDADGDEQWHAVHTEALLFDGVVLREELFIEDDEIESRRHVVNTKEYVTRVPDGIGAELITRLLGYDL